MTRNPVAGDPPGPDAAVAGAAVRRSSVIVLGPRSVRAQRASRYVAGTTAHPTRLPPDLAATLIDTYSRPGDLVLDPLVGTGTVLVEAVHLGRNALGLADDPGWVALARANLALARRHHAPGHGRVVAADTTRLPAGVPTELRGQVNLVLTSPPPAHTIQLANGHRRDRTIGRRHRVPLRDALTAILAGCLPLLAPDGIVAVVSRPWYRDGTLTDQSADVLLAASAAGFTLVADRRAVPHQPMDGAGVAAVSDVDGAAGRGSRDGVRVAMRHHDIAVFQAGQHNATGGGSRD